MLVCFVGLCTGSVLAAETPTVLEPAEVSATNAELRGVLNPKSTGELGEQYHFVYRAATSGSCEGAEQHETPSAEDLGAEAETVRQRIEELAPGTKYIFCLVSESASHTVFKSSSLSFETTIPPEVPAEVEAVEVTSRSATLTGVLNPAGPGSSGTFQFIYAKSSTECEAAQTFGAPSPPGLALGNSAEEVETHVVGLQPNSTYTVCLFVQNRAFESARSIPVSFHTATSAPEVTAAAARNVHSTSADILASVNPGGLTTSYVVQYASDSAFAEGEWATSGKSTTPSITLTASSEAIQVNQSLSGLLPATQYHARVVASNSDSETGVAGEEVTFTTLASTESAELPDGRNYELVTAPGSVETYLSAAPQLTGNPEPQTLLPFAAAEDGSAVVYAADPAAGTGTGETGNGLGNQWIALSTPDGWTARDITPEHNLDSEYQEFSSTLKSGIFEGAPDLSVESDSACQRVLYTTALDAEFAPLFGLDAGATGCGRALSSGSTRDGSVTIFQTEAALTPNAVEATELPPERSIHGGNSIGSPCEWGCNLYAARSGHLTLVNTLAGVDVPNANFGGYAGETSSIDLSGAISDDGKRIFWTDTTPGENFKHIFVLENETTQVPVSGAGPAQYWAATPDGRFAYYTEGGALWQFDTSTNTPSQLTAHAGVVGVIGTNTSGEDGAWVYIVASGKLASAASKKVCETLKAQEDRVVREHEEAKLTQTEYEQKFAELLAEEAVEREGGTPAHTGCNLYVLHGGTTQLVAVLSPTDMQAATDNLGLIKRSGDWSADPGERTAEISKDGEHLVFQSVRPLTGYKNVFTPNEGVAKLTTQVFIYDGTTAGLDCASCQPSGEPPVFPENPEEATRLPVSAELMTYQRRWMSENGNRVFFNSIQPLVAQAIPGVQGVYEWEREGEGSCAARTPQRTSHGCLTLLSGASSARASYLVDADSVGDNVFLEHVGSLGGWSVPVDRNEIYDVRVGASSASTGTGCFGSSCEAVVVPEGETSAPATSTFAGIGNYPPAPPVAHVTPLKGLAKELSVCRKRFRGHVRKRRACEVKARRRNAHRADNKRRTTKGKR